METGKSKTAGPRRQLKPANGTDFAGVTLSGRCREATSSYTGRSAAVVDVAAVGRRRNSRVGNADGSGGYLCHLNSSLAGIWPRVSPV